MQAWAQYIDKVDSVTPLKKAAFPIGVFGAILP
jgi:hypothetical protein